MPYRAWIDTEFRPLLFERYPDFPVQQLINQLRRDLPNDMRNGRTPPFPYGGMTRMLIYEWVIEGRVYRVTTLYEIDDAEQSICIFNVGIVDLGEGV